jgi:crotonobetainyl-CoA:carnitine CoA-transferase CaiB-like acyl-CoA transferase
MLPKLPSGSSTGATITVAGTPVKASRDEPRVGGRAPDIGEHSVAILAELGYSQDEIEALRAANVIGT